MQGDFRFGGFATACLRGERRRQQPEGDWLAVLVLDAEDLTVETGQDRDANSFEGCVIARVSQNLTVEFLRVGEVLSIEAQRAQLFTGELRRRGASQDLSG